MREIPRENKLEVADYYIMGYPYSYIEDVTGISHGSIVNIVKELEDGILSVPGTSFDLNPSKHNSVCRSFKGFGH